MSEGVDERTLGGALGQDVHVLHEALLVPRTVLDPVTSKKKKHKFIKNQRKINLNLSDFLDVGRVNFGPWIEKNLWFSTVFSLLT